MMEVRILVFIIGALLWIVFWLNDKAGETEARLEHARAMAVLDRDDRMSYLRKLQDIKEAYATLSGPEFAEWMQGGPETKQKSE